MPVARLRQLSDACERNTSYSCVVGGLRVGFGDWAASRLAFRNRVQRPGSMWMRWWLGIASIPIRSLHYLEKKKYAALKMDLEIVGTIMQVISDH
jgi:hypothetical protein